MVSTPEPSLWPPDAQSVVFPAQHTQALLDMTFFTACTKLAPSSLPSDNAAALPGFASHDLLGIALLSQDKPFIPGLGGAGLCQESLFGRALISPLFDPL